MSQARKLSRHNSRQSSICETTSVGSTKSDAKSSSSGSGAGGSDYTLNSNGSNQHQNNNNNTFKTKSNGTLNKLSINGQGNNNETDHIKSASILNVAEMLLHGVADNEILDIWLKSIECDEFLNKFIDAGYDMPTISRITPQDLTAIGVTEPEKRLKILTEIKKLNLQDGIPTFKPASLSHWLSLLRLDSYYFKSLCDQQVDTIDKLCQLTWEDFEELGISKLGHQKRFQLAIERYKELDSESKNPIKAISEPIYDTNPSQILLVSSTENHSMNGPIINKQSSTSELSSTGSGSMHSVYSAASAHYQPTYAPLPQPDNNNHNQIVGPQAAAPPPPLQQHQPPPPPPPATIQQQQQQIYSQPPPPPLIYQSPAQLLSAIMPPKQQQSHYQPMFPKQQHQLPPQVPHFVSMGSSGSSSSNHNIKCGPNQALSDTSSLNGCNMSNGILPPLGGAHPQSNRQSFSQLSFNAQFANLPKHQQQLLQQSSIYATLSRQPAKVKQPPPPVPIRTNSLKTNSLTDEYGEFSSQTNSSSSSGSSLQRSNTNRMMSTNGITRTNQFSSQTLLAKNKSFSGHNPQLESSRAKFLNNNNYGNQPQFNPPPLMFQHQEVGQQIYGTASQPNATTGKDDDFPPPPSPLSMTELNEQDMVSLNLDSAASSGFSTDCAASQMMSFRVGI